MAGVGLLGVPLGLALGLVLALLVAPGLQYEVRSCSDPQDSISATTPCTQRQLRDDVLETYGSPSPPRGIEGTGPVPVLVSIDFPNFENFFDKEQVLVILVTVRYVWREPMLSWALDPLAAAQTPSLILTTDDIWYPNLDLQEVTADEGGGWDSQMTEESILVEADGIVVWERQGTIRILCSADVQDFPFDKPACNLTLGSTREPNVVLSRVANLASARSALLAYNLCEPGFGGVYCDQARDPCELDPCVNGRCLTTNSSTGGLSFFCDCELGWEGEFCGVDSDECAPGPCLNGGTCVDGLGFFTCVCDIGWFGETCSDNFDDCALSPCQNGGECVDGVGSFECLCPVGYNGTLCEVDVDECLLLTPCGNGTCAEAGPGNFTCSCLPGFEGEFCDQNVDECASLPCQNGATCTDLINAFACSCPPAWTGASCREEVLQCLSAPCENGGTCIETPPGVAEFVCRCPAGFVGERCEEPVDACASDPCLVGASACATNGADFECTCIEGWTGPRCGQNVDACREDDGLACMNGRCFDSMEGLGFTCDCFLGFSGTICDVRVAIDFCRDDPCFNGATCLSLEETFACVCASGWSGPTCERPISQCQDDEPCVSGTCQDRLNGYVCVCDPGFSGVNCSEPFDPCQSEPCLNGGNCTATGTDPEQFNCTCPAPWIGPACGQLMDGCAAAGICANGGTCLSRALGEFECDCPPGFFGPLCTMDFNECDSQPCQHSGVCTDLAGTFGCSCAGGWSGAQCEVFDDACASSPCQNGATCSPVLSGFECACQLGFFGQLCEQGPLLLLSAVVVDDLAARTTSMPVTTTTAVPTTGNATGVATTAAGDGTTANGTAVTPTAATSPAQSSPTSTSAPASSSAATSSSAAPPTTPLASTANVTTAMPTNASNTSVPGNLTTSTMAPTTTIAAGTNQTRPANWTQLFDTASAEVNATAAILSRLAAAGIPMAALGTVNFELPDLVAIQFADAGVDSLFVRQAASSALVGFLGFAAGSSEVLVQPEPVSCHPRLMPACANAGLCNTDGNRSCSCPAPFFGPTCQGVGAECDGDRAGPCQNSAACFPNRTGFVCECPAGFQGEFCAEPVDPCFNACPANLTCDPLLPSERCVCPAGKQGKLCATDIRECAVSAACANGVCEELAGGGFVCACAPGWIGARCDVPADPCSSSPCQFGGTCLTTSPVSFDCVCPAAWSGPTCGVEVDGCSSSPCRNGGSCTRISPGTLLTDGNTTAPGPNPTFVCSCPEGLLGATCEARLDPCADEPCVRGRCRETSEGGFLCACDAGYEGARCESQVNICQLNNPCQHGSNCFPVPLGFECACAAGWTGQTCSDSALECSSNPCNSTNSIACEDRHDGFACRCKLGWEGLLCDSVVDLCAQQPELCLNGAACIPGAAASFSCNCSAGFSGRFCEVSTAISCSAQPCFNGATCSNSTGTGTGFECSCAPGWRGETCAEVDRCASNPCLNQATCVDESGAAEVSCACTPGFSGRLCGELVDFCVNVTCQNNGTCVNDGASASAICLCGPGFSGEFCSESVRSCLSQPCLQGQCLERFDGFSCLCDAGYEGTTCETETDECERQPCVRGRCVDLIGDFACLCPAAFEGPNCQFEVDECRSQPCLNDGACTDLLGDYRCECPASFTGKDCESETAYQSSLQSGGRKFQIASVTALALRNQSSDTGWDPARESARVDWVWTLTLQRYPNFYYNRVIGPFLVTLVLALVVLMIPWRDDMQTEDQFFNNTHFVPRISLEGTSDRLNFGVTAVLTVIAISWTVSDLIPLTQDPTWIDTMANAILLIVAWSVLSTVLFSVYYTHRLNHGHTFGFCYRVAAATYFPREEQLRWHHKARLSFLCATIWFRGGSENHNGFVFQGARQVGVGGTDARFIDNTSARIDRRNHQLAIRRLMSGEEGLHFPVVAMACCLFFALMFRDALDKTENSTVDSSLTEFSYYLLVSLAVIFFLWLCLSVYSIFRSKRVKLTRAARGRVHANAISSVGAAAWDEEIVRGVLEWQVEDIAAWIAHLLNSSADDVLVLLKSKWDSEWQASAFRGAQMYDLTMDDWREMGFTHASASVINSALVQSIRTGGPAMYIQELEELVRLKPSQPLEALNRVLWRRHQRGIEGDNAVAALAEAPSDSSVFQSFIDSESLSEEADLHVSRINGLAFNESETSV